MTRIIDAPVLWINPRQLTRVVIMSCLYKKGGVVFSREERLRLQEIEYYSGDWDLKTTEFKRNPFFAVLKTWDRGGDFKHTATWLRTLKKWGKERAEKNFHAWHRIYKDMKENGYRSTGQSHPWNEYVVVCESRHGELLFYLGQHRLAMAQHLGIKKIPVKVGFRHAQTKNKTGAEIELLGKILKTVDRTRISALCKKYEEAGMSARYILKRFGFERQIPVRIGYCLDDLNLAAQQSLSILDIGTGAGWFPYIARHLGHTVYLTDIPGAGGYPEMLNILGLSLDYKFAVARQIPMPLGDLSVDIISATGAAFYGGWGVDDWWFWLKDCAEYLKPGGRLFMVLNNTGPGRDGFLAFQKLSQRKWWTGKQTVIIPKGELS